MLLESLKVRNLSSDSYQPNKKLNMGKLYLDSQHWEIHIGSSL